MRRRLKGNSSKMANCVPLTIVLVSLFTLAIAASSSPIRSGEQLRLVKPIVRLPTDWLANEARTLEALGLSSAQQLNQDNLKQAISSISSGPLVGQQQQQQQIDDNESNNNNNDDNDDEQFLRQLIIAGDYLKDKLAARGSDADLQLANESPRYALELPSKFYLAPEYPQRDPSGDAAAADLNSEVDLSNDNINNNNDANAKNNLLKYLLLLDKAQVAQDDNNNVAHAEKRHTSEQEQEPEDRDELVTTSSNKAPIKYTTLLEDEPNLTDNNQTTTSTSAPVTTSSTTASYGQLISSSEDGHHQDVKESTGSSPFARMYNNLAHYLPFLGQLNILRGPESSGNEKNVTLVATQKTHSSQSGDKDQHKVATVLTPGQQVVTQSNDNEVNIKQANDKHKDEQPARQRVSMTLNKKNSHELGEEDDDDADNDEVNVNRKSEEDNSGEFSGQFKAIESESESASESEKVSSAVNSKRLSISLTPGEEFELSQMIGPVVSSKEVDSSKQGVNLIRQSSLVLPLSSAREFSSSDSGGESLLGKYIYAPTQHYYLSAPPHHSNQPSAAYAAAYQKAPPPSADSWNLGFGSHSLGGAPTTAAQTQSGKPPTNDLYFLVMVGAFCMMAMAIVLAAGAFAYRVQQQRKSSQEPDYPTYGVVGPNNMASKCAAFGYFNNNHTTGNPPAYGGGGSAKFGGAGSTGSAKHLAELYAAAAAAAAGVGGCGDSGIASSLDKCSSGSSNSVAVVTTASGNKKQLPVSITTTTSTGTTTSSTSTSTSSSQSTNNNSVSASAGQGGNQDAARMYHYQHQKQQMILSSGASFNQAAGKRHTSASDLDSEDEDNDDGSYTVYECPGLASAHEMEIKNPLFNDDHSP